MTVRGPIESSELGRTLEHEHILVDFIGAEETGYHRWDREEVEKKVLPFLKEIKELGFNSLVECTPAFLGRDPRLLKSLSEKSGLHLITNTGYYGARENKYIPAGIQAFSVDELATRWIKEFKEGIEDTGIKPGFIKIGVDRDPTLSPMHEKLVRAACKTHLATGLTMACHTGATAAIFQMVDILREEGVSPVALIWVHAPHADQESLLKAAKLGLWISIDNVNDTPKRIDFISKTLVVIKDAGLLGQVLLSHDAGWYRPEEENGGNFRSYTAISKSLIPKLLTMGFNQTHIDQLLITNPQHALNWESIKSNEYFLIMKFLLTMSILLLPWAASSATLRMEGDRAWLTAAETPLIKVLDLFVQRGVEVLVDPTLHLDRVSGEWENAKIDRLISQLVHPHSYLMEWKRTTGPLGNLYQIAALRIYSDGNLSAARPLSEKGRVLDVVQGKDGLRYLRGELMVGFKEGSTTEDLNALLEKLGGTVVEVIDPPGIYRIKLNDGMPVEQAVEIAKAHDGVEGAEPNLAFPKMEMPTVPIAASGGGINLHLQPGETAIAVFDSGLDPKYANLAFIRGMYNAIDPSAAMSDPTGHGTLVALVASGAITPLGADPSERGVPILAVRVFDENGYTSADTVMRAIDYALNSNVKIINLSFGTYEEVGFIEDAINYAAQQGVDMIISAGNDGIDKSMNPAASPFTRSIGAKNQDGTIADYSNTGDTVTGYEYGSVVFEGKKYNGTSFASPYWAYKLALEK